MNLRSVMVTGGSGLLGRFVVDALLRDGFEVSVLDIKPPTRAVRFVDCTILDLSTLKQAFSGIDAVIHLAGIDDGNDFPDQTYFETNVQGAWNVLHAAQSQGIKRAVLASSTATLGLGFERPPDYLPVDEAHPLRPSDTYGLTKQLIEDVARSFVRNGDLSVICLRPTLVVRPERERAILVQLSLRNPDLDAGLEFISPEGVEPYGGLSATRSYVRSVDCAQCFRQALDYAGDPFDIFNVSARDGIGRLRTLERMEQVFGHVPPVRRQFVYERDPFASTLDISKTQALLGWSPAIGWLDVVASHEAPSN